ncbi:MAG: hypothetical protein KJ709_01405 [Nanoarchaeota archaeon]|nr:hypothetical protein [Nanoarchaeota archaeon]
MALQKLKEEILQQAQQQAKDKEDQAKAVVLAEDKKAKTAIAELKQKGSEALKQEQEELMRKELSAARFENMRQLQHQKKVFIDDSFDRAKRQLVGLPDDRRAEIVKRLLEMARSELDVAKVFVNGKDTKFADGAEAREMTGGLIAENDDGTVAVDYSYETLLEGIRETGIEDIAGLLFGR